MSHFMWVLGRHPAEQWSHKAQTRWCTTPHTGFQFLQVKFLTTDELRYGSAPLLWSPNHPPPLSDPALSSILSQIFSSSEPTTCYLDPIPGKFIKALFIVIGDPPLDIINKSLRSGISHAAFKTAVVTPYLKGPSLVLQTAQLQTKLNLPPHVKAVTKGVCQPAHCPSLRQWSSSWVSDPKTLPTL